MGLDAMSSLNDRMQVHRIERLRVVDTSVMPTLTSGNTNAPTIMIGEKAADFILGKAASGVRPIKGTCLSGVRTGRMTTHPVGSAEQLGFFQGAKYDGIEDGKARCTCRLDRSGHALGRCRDGRRHPDRQGRRHRQAAPASPPKLCWPTAMGTTQGARSPWLG